MKVEWITAGIAVFVASIGYFQYRTARIKAVSDLFDRRFKVYEKVDSAVVGYLLHGAQYREMVPKTNSAIVEATFLFGKDVVEFLEKLRDDMSYVNVYENAPPREQAAHEEWQRRMLASGQRIAEFTKRARPIFAPYMHLGVKVPYWSRPRWPAD